MSKVLKKVSALFLLILMISSVSFNIISYAAERLEAIEELEEVEKLEAIEELDDTEKLEAIEELEEVEKLEAIEELDDTEKLEAIEELEEVEKLEAIEELDDTEKLEAIEELEEVEKLEAIEELDDTEKLEAIEELEDNPYDLMITNRNNTNQKYKADAVAKNVNSGDDSDYHVLLTQDENGQYYYCMEKGGALMLYANGGATLREFYYKATPYTSKDIKSAQGMPLIYLSSSYVKEINGLKLDENNNREKLIQYYIWKSGINEGYDVTVPGIYSDIVNSLLKCVNGKIVIGEDIIDTKTGIITINGINYRVTSFSAYRYTSKLVYRIDNGKGYVESNYSGSGQEIFTFTGELVPDDVPKIKIHKEDMKGNSLSGAVFTIYDKETGKEIQKYESLEDGYTGLIPVENGKEYIVKETQAPLGYKATTDYAIIIVSENGEISYKVYDKNGKEIKEDKNWSQRELDDEIQLILTVDNEEDNTPKIQIYKHDNTGNAVPGVEFTIIQYPNELKLSTNKLVVQENGYTNIINIDGMEKEKIYTFILKETNTPKKYKKIESDITLNITIDKEGNISWSASWMEENNKNITRSGNGNNILLDVENKKEDEKLDQMYPLLMYIKGTVFLDGIEGKNSKLDGYFNPENNSDKGLEGIKVEVYDEATNSLANFATREKLTPTDETVEYNLDEVDFNALDKYGKATTYTDENGNFKFYGLNPSHTYYLVFTYNGMRYAEIKATTETGIDTTTYDITKENASKATEIDREIKITKVFSEIGNYPYNYYSETKKGYNIAYTQDDVEEAIKTGLSKCGNDYNKLYSNLTQNMDESMAYFIQDTQVTAKISGLGNILTEAENKVKEYNRTIKINTGDTVYPVVENHNTPKVYDVKFNKEYGYRIYRYYADPIIVDGEIIGYSSPSWHYVGNGSVGTLSYDERVDGEWIFVSEKYIQQDKQLTDKLNTLIASSNSETRYESNITGNWTELKDGYTSEEINDVQWAKFDLGNQQYLGDWNNKYQAVTYEDSYKKLSEYLKQLNEDITKNLPCANLGVQYRNTFDVALYNDVQKAEVTINGVLGTYKYDKRAANGNAFSFGVNDYDLNSYYKNLTEGNVSVLRDLKYNTTISSTDEYLNYLRTTDIHYSSDVQKTETGLAVAGGYDDNNNSIYLTYKIRLINQSSVKGTITEIVDYYSKDFEVVKVYDDNNKEYEFSNTSIYNDRGIKNNAVNGYNTVYIKVNNMELTNNESQNLYLVLKMKDIPNTLTSEVLNREEGYKIGNLAEINGYKTANGYIDIDSMPGNIVETNRFENGKYEDDESKSPTLIFKNPSEVGRTISGVIFEDATTGEWVTIQTRQSTANNQYNEKDTLIYGATVQLIQILADGTEKLSAQTCTTENGEYKFIHVRPGNYIVKFAYGNSDKTVLTNKNKVDDVGHTINVLNAKSYNGESFESTEKKVNTTIGAEGYWYTDSDIDTNLRYSDAIDNKDRRETVTKNFATINNGKAEILNSYKDSKVNRNLVNELVLQGYMFATTDTMKLEMEYVGSKNQNTNGTTTTANEDGKYTYTYDITNVDFGIVERSRAKLDIVKKVSYISLVDSTGKVITSGTYADWQAGNIKHVKWVMGTDGFVGMEIDTELLNGATLKITYDITVVDNSEAGNIISDIEVVDYVSNNLNYSTEYATNEGKTNKDYGWETITTNTLIDNGYVNKTSVTSAMDSTNKIDLSTYQTLLKTTFKPGETKRLTLEKNLSPEEDSDFNYANKVEIISSKNTTGRGDYSSIYGNLDPNTYTSKQGNLYWDYIKGTTSSSDNDTETITENSGFNAIRIAEGDSANAEKLEISVPTGREEIKIPGEYYIFGLTLTISLVIGLILVKKYRELN